jgi:hypothetical protein
MRESTLDLLKIIVAGLFNGTYVTFFVLYPYLGSYLKTINNQIRMQHVYMSMFVMYIGTITGSRCMPPLLSRLGMQNLFYLLSILTMLNTVGYQWTTSFFRIMLMGWFTGGVIQIFFLTSQTFFKLKYPTHFAQFFGLMSLGQAGTIVLTLFMTTWLLNPDNLTLDYMEFGEPTFPPSVSANMPTYLWVMGFLNFASLAGVGYFMDPNMGKNIEETPAIELRKTAVEEELVVIEPTELVAPEVPFEWRREVFSPTFLMIFFCAVTRSGSHEYFISNYHYIGNILLKDDAKSALFFGIATIPNLVGRVTTGYLWERLGLVRCLITCYLGALLLDLVFIFWAQYSEAGFFVVTNMTRFTNIYNILFNSITLFSVFDLKTALHLAPFWDLTNICKSFMVNVVQYLFGGNQNFARVFTVFFFFEVTCLGVFIWMANNKFLERRKW